MEVTAQELQERYQSMSTEELIDIARRSELTDVASDVMRRVLVARGVGIDEAISHAVVTENKLILLAWEAATKPFPCVWVGYVITVLFFLGAAVEFSRHPEIEDNISLPLKTYSTVGWFVGFGYWLFCVHRLHWIVAEATRGRYPITPDRAAGFHFIPFFNLYWIFRWPAALGRFLRENGHRTLLGGWLGIPILFGFLVAKVIDSAVGLLILFPIMTYVVRAVRRAATAKPPVSRLGR